jgi:hypothetical protein
LHSLWLARNLRAWFPLEFAAVGVQGDPDRLRFREALSRGDSSCYRRAVPAGVDRACVDPEVFRTHAQRCCTCWIPRAHKLAREAWDRSCGPCHACSGQTDAIKICRGARASIGEGTHFRWAKSPILRVGNMGGSAYRGKRCEGDIARCPLANPDRPSWQASMVIVQRL